MDATAGLGSLQQAIQNAILTYSLISVLSSLIGLIVMYLIIRAAVQSGTMAALVDAGLVKKESPWAQRYYAQQAANEANATDSWDSTSARPLVEIDESNDPFSAAD